MDKIHLLIKIKGAFHFQAKNVLRAQIWVESDQIDLNSKRNWDQRNASIAMNI